MHNQRRVTNYIKYLQSKGYSHNTITVRQVSLKKFMRFLTSRNLQIQDTVEQDIFHYKEKLLVNLNPATVATHLTAIKSFYVWLYKSNYIFINPAQNIQTGISYNKLPEVLSVREVSELLNLLPVNMPTAKRNKALLELAYSSLLRREELLNLKTTDLNLTEMTVRLKRKGNKEALLPFGQCALNALKDYLVNERPQLTTASSDNSLWLNSKNGEAITYKGIDKIIKQIRKSTGINFSLHTLRRSGATHLLQNGASLAIVQEMLSHENLKAVKHYLRLNVKDLKETLNKSDRLK